MKKNIDFLNLISCSDILKLVILSYMVISCKEDATKYNYISLDYPKYLAVAENFYDNNNLDSTYFYLTKIKTLFPEIPEDIDSSKIGLNNTLLGFYFEDLNQPDSALFYHQLAYQDKMKYFKGNHPEVSKSINNIGLLYQRYGQYETSRQYFLEAITQVKKSSIHQKELIKYTLNLANNYYLKNDFHVSLKYLMEIIFISDNSNLENIYLAIANNYVGLKDYTKALSFYRNAYKIENKNLKIKAQIANNIGNTYSAMNKEKLALVYYQKSLKIRKWIKNTSKNELGEIYANIGSTLLKRNELIAAKDHLSKAKNYYLKSNPLNQTAISGIEENFGQLYLKKFDTEEAIKSYKQAQYIHDSILFTPELESGNRYLNLASLYMMPPFRDTLKGLFFLGKIGKTATESQRINKLFLFTSISIQQNKIKEAEKYLSVIKSLIQNYTFENKNTHIETLLQIASFFEKINQLNESHKFNNQAFKLILQLTDKEDLNFYQLFFKYYLIETNLLLKKNKNIEASQIALDKYKYIDSIQTHKSTLKIDRLINEMKTSFISNYFEAKSFHKKDLGKVIFFPYSKDKFPKTSPNTMFIRYWTTQNKLFIWTQVEDKYDVLIKHLDTPLDRTILSVRNAIRELPLSGIKSKENYEIIYRSLVHKLSALLIPQIPEGIKNIILFPDHILTILPFEILYGEKEMIHPLVEKYAISYHHITPFKFNQTTNPLKDKILAFSPSFQGDKRGFANLKYSEIEIKKISQHLPTVPFKNKQASVKNFKKEAPKYNMIHIATHSDPNLNDEEEGGELIFTENLSTKEPSSLYANQISGLKICANLVVLSACQSAIGSYIPSQGMNGIAQAFLNGGASSVLTSLWQVDDRSTSLFMNSFYYYLSKGYSKNKALQITKKKMLNQSPYFWAPFILIGDTGAI